MCHVTASEKANWKKIHVCYKDPTNQSRYGFPKNCIVFLGGKQREGHMRRAGMAGWCKMKGETVHVDDCIAVKIVQTLVSVVLDPHVSGGYSKIYVVPYQLKPMMM